MNASIQTSDGTERCDGDVPPVSLGASPRHGHPAGPERARSGSPDADQAESGDRFLCRFGDVIDDRVAEALDEILGEQDALRPRWRLRPGLAADLVVCDDDFRPRAVMCHGEWLAGPPS